MDVAEMRKILGSDVDRFTDEELDEQLVNMRMLVHALIDNDLKKEDEDQLDE